MKTFTIVTNIDHIYQVTAKDKDEAVELVLSGEIDQIDENFMGYDVTNESKAE